MKNFFIGVLQTALALVLALSQVPISALAGTADFRNLATALWSEHEWQREQAMVEIRNATPEVTEQITIEALRYFDTLPSAEDMGGTYDWESFRGVFFLAKVLSSMKNPSLKAMRAILSDPRLVRTQHSIINKLSEIPGREAEDVLRLGLQSPSFDIREETYEALSHHVVTEGSILPMCRNIY